MTSSLSVERPRRRRSSSAAVGGRMNTVAASRGNARLELRAALHVDVEERDAAGAERLVHRGAQRAVALAVDLGPLRERALRDELARSARASTKW